MEDSASLKKSLKNLCYVNFSIKKMLKNVDQIKKFAFFLLSLHWNAS